MRNLIFILFCFLGTTLFSQTIDYPKFQLDSLGQKVIVMTIEQAQALDNSTDLVPLFNKLNLQIGTVDSVCIKVVNEKDIVIAKQDLQISDQKQLLVIKNREVGNLQSQITDYRNNQSLTNLQLANKDKEIKLHLDKIRNQQVKMIVGGSVSGLLIIGLVVGILATN